MAPKKIAFFADGSVFKHVARRLSSGRWTSKLGDHCDIEHELEDLVSSRSPHWEFRYGQLAGFMRRRRSSDEPQT